MLEILCVCGARPNFMKIAPLVDALSRTDGVEPAVVHTGQHYDERLSEHFFDDLGIPKPDVNLGVGSGSQAAQTAEIMRRFEPVCLARQPDWVVVVGDVNSTLAAALVAAKLGIPVAHVEAGLRSFDRTMPEEINRLLTDTISDKLFVTEPSGVENLRREGIAPDKVHLVGNVMIDTLLRFRAEAEKSDIRIKLGLPAQAYALVTLHRPGNVDDIDAFSSVLEALDAIGSEMPVIFPIHPRSKHNLDAMELASRTARSRGLKIIEPLGYLDFLRLMADAALVLTDSGGIQEETTILDVPCLTLRENTERPITVTHGTNRLTGRSTEAILTAYRAVRIDPPRRVSVPEGWDGHAAERVVKYLLGGTRTIPPRDSRPCDRLEEADPVGLEARR